MADKILSVKEVAAAYGLTTIEHCNCGGVPTEKYRDPKNKYLLSWRKTRYIFKFKKFNSTEKDWTPVRELQAYMNKYFENESIAGKN